MGAIQRVGVAGVSVTLPCGVTLTAEVAISAAGTSYGLWGSGRWGEFIWGPATVWEDLSTRLRKFSTNRAFQRDLQVWRTGVGSIVLDNRDGNLSPDKLDGTYAVGGITMIRPSRPVRLRASYGGITYGLIRGRCADWEEDWTDAPIGAGDATVTIGIEDDWAALAVDGEEQSAVGTGDVFGVRMHRILDAIGHRGERSIDEGSVTMQATTLASQPVQELTITAESEGGAVWVDADGVLRAARRYALIEELRSNSTQATFGDDIAGGELPYSNPRQSFDRSLLCNYASYKRLGGAAQVASDPVSISVHTMKKRTRTDLVCETDAQALSLAQWRVAQYKNPERRITRITVYPQRDPDVLFPAVLGLRERDLVLVKRRPAGGHTISRYCHVSGIHHSWGARQSWRTDIDLWSATPYIALRDSRWGVGRWGEFVWL